MALQRHHACISSIWIWMYRDRVRVFVYLTRVDVVALPLIKRRTCVVEPCVS